MIVSLLLAVFAQTNGWLNRKDNIQALQGGENPDIVNEATQRAESEGYG